MSRPTTNDRAARLVLARNSLTLARRMADQTTADYTHYRAAVLSSLEYLLVAVDALIAEAEEKT